MKKIIIIAVLLAAILLSACSIWDKNEPAPTAEITQYPVSADIVEPTDTADKMAEPTPIPTPELPAPYYLKVNLECNTITVYSLGENGEMSPFKAMVCSTGKATPKSGVYSLDGQGKWEWLGLFGDVYGHYCTQIRGNILFHSVPYLVSGDPSSLEYWEFDQLGTACSLGCVRLQVIDAKWVFDHKEDITAVEFYSDADPGPLGKPVPPNIGGNLECRNWDPTDPDENNPWNK